METMNKNEGKFDESRFEYLIKCMNVNPQYIEEKRQETLAWKQEVMVKVTEWHSEMNRYIHSSVNRLTVTQLLDDLGSPKALAVRMTTKRCMWLL